MGDLSFGCFGFLGMTMTRAPGSLRVELSIVGYVCPSEWSVMYMGSCVLVEGHGPGHFQVPRIGFGEVAVSLGL